ncbi:MAG: nitrilase-related carbon-nitrogen hydrolase, partial [Deltaproteobacteria bacterium]|nr:nitrilase-related carbon-nitrogen hydrolase [Deltaproteobacteria bacterium]
MKIALIQFNPIVGDIAGNSRKILTWIQKAKKEGAKLVVFHEMALLGYPPRDLLELPYVIGQCEVAADEIARAALGIAVVFGSVQKNQASGKPLSNVGLWCEEGKVKNIARKTLLPSYDVFDETRYFEPGIFHEVISFQEKSWGLSVCEDIWFDPALWSRQLYPADPVEDLVKKGAQVIVNISASPYSMGKFDQRRKILSRLAVKHKATVIYVNQVGGNDELIFDGGSMVVDPQGKIKALAPFFKEGMTLVEMDHERSESPLIPEEMALLEGALTTGVR